MSFRILFISFLLAFASFAFAAPTSFNGEEYYLIYLKNTNGEYKVYKDSNTQKSDPSQVFVLSTVNKINNLIVANKRSFKNQSKLAEIQAKPQNTNTYCESKFVYPISSADDSVVLLAYLSEKLTSEVLSLPNVVACIPNRDTLTPESNYKTEDILSETGWKNLGVREYADEHLYLISQGLYNETLNKGYDNNYYYPASAGKGVDIIILDSSFNFTYSEFSNTNERTARCAGNIFDGVLSQKNIDNYCGDTDVYHGKEVADLAAGLVHGVASRANIHGISLPTIRKNETVEVLESDILGGLQYIYEKMRPYRTVVNLSIGGLDDLTEENVNVKFKQYIYNQYDKITKRITEKGGIIVAAAGNEGKDLSKVGKNVLNYPCELSSVICVGGITKFFANFHDIYEHGNYGRNIDLYASYYANVEIINNDEVQKIRDHGTSLSSPIVAGVIATVMSEFSGTKYTKDRMLYLLKKHGNPFEYQVYNGTITGIMVNNGKQSFTGDLKCGNRYGSCPQGQCCSFHGYCGTSLDYCSLDQGCQSLFGKCS